MEIAEWLLPYINKECPYCGTPIVNNEALTDRYCPNPKCYGHMAYKIEALAKRFGVKGIGPATARDAAILHKWTYHVEAIPWMLKEKPELYLYEVGEICMIKGHQKKWKEYCEGHQNMMQVLTDPRVPAEIREQSRLIFTATKYVKIEKNLLGRILTIMMTGSFAGYRSRNDWLLDMNNKYGDVIQLRDVGKRRTGVDYLVKEPYTSDHEKSNIAREEGISIISPHDLEERLKWYRTYIIEGGKHT